MFGFRLPPDGGPSKKRVPSPTLSSSSSEPSSISSEESDSKSDSNSSDDEEREEFNTSKSSETLAIYEDFMPEESVSEKKSPSVDSCQLPSTETNALLDCLTKNLTTYFNSIQAENAGPSKSATKTKKTVTAIKPVEKEQKIVKSESLPKRKSAKQHNKELERLKKRAATLARLGKSYTEKVEDFLKEFEK